MNRPLRDQPRTGRMSHAGETDIEQGRLGRIITPIIRTIKNVAAVIKKRICVVRHSVEGSVIRPAAVFGAMEHHIVAALRQRGVAKSWSRDTSITFDEILVPPPDDF